MKIKFPAGMQVELRYKEDSDTPVQNLFTGKKTRSGWQDECGIRKGEEK